MKYKQIKRFIYVLKFHAQSRDIRSNNLESCIFADQSNEWRTFEIASFTSFCDIASSLGRARPWRGGRLQHLLRQAGGGGWSRGRPIWHWRPPPPPPPPLPSCKIGGQKESDRWPFFSSQSHFGNTLSGGGEGR